MATIKITDLPNLLSGSATGSDVIPIVDVSADITKKITIEQLSGLVGGGGGGGGGGAGIPTGIDNCTEPTQIQSTCTQVIVGGQGNCIDATGFVETFPDVLNGPNFSATLSGSGFNFIGGGACNYITGSFGVVNEGWLGAGNVVVGGAANVIKGIETTCIYDRNGGNFIGGGNMNCIVHNTNSNAYGPALNTISGGYCNSINHSECNDCYLVGNTISGGYNNSIGNIRDTRAPQDYDGSNTIGGGYYNRMDGGNYNTISGGGGHCICSQYTTSGMYGASNTISGGYGHQLGICFLSIYSTYNNCIRSERNGTCRIYFTCSAYNSSNVIAGGYKNYLGIGFSNFIGAGQQNFIGQKSGVTAACGATFNIIGGGKYNAIVIGESIIGYANPYGNADANTIVNGDCNSIRHSRGSTIAGGYCNDILNSSGSFIAGELNSITHTQSHIVGNNITSRATGSLHVNNLLLETGSIPTSDPGIPGMLYIADGALKVSGCL